MNGRKIVDTKRTTGFYVTAVISLLFVLNMSGCFLAVHPVISAEDAERDDRLIGHWIQEAGEERMVITQGEGDYYTVEYKDDEVQIFFDVLLGKIGDRTVLDIAVAPQEDDPESAYAQLMITAHIMLVADIQQDVITLYMMDIMDTMTALDSGELDLAFTADQQKIVLLDSTEKLQESLESYLSKDDVLDEMEGNWVRIPPEQLATEAGVPDAAMPCLEASEWAKADRLFLWHPYWVGGDGASSVDLGDGRVLWLFGDSWIDPSGQNSREDATMVSNSVAIQQGYDPSEATITFYWGAENENAPEALIPDQEGIRHWFGNGLLVGEKLVLFMNQVQDADEGLGFESVGWAAFLVQNPQSEPDHWEIAPLDTPGNVLGVLAGFGAVWKEEGFVYAFGSQDPVKTHPVFVLRWLEEDVAAGDVSNPEWWSVESTWVSDSATVPRKPLFNNGQSEFSIQKDLKTNRYLAFHTVGFGSAEIAMRTAKSITGPWSDPIILYQPPEYGRDNIMIYSGKAHPELVGADQVLTYATNSFNFSDHLSDPLLYFPRFVRLTNCSN